MTTDPFKDIFGGDHTRGADLADIKRILKELQGLEINLEDSDPRRTGLLRTFTKEVRRGDRAFLERAVVEHQAEVYERDSDIPLMKAYAMASIFVENLPIGYESLGKIKDPTLKQRQAMAILAYEIGRPQEAISHLKGIEDKVAPARIVYSLSLHSKGNRDPQSHNELLKPLLGRLGLANTIMGTLYFNSGDTERAEESFSKAVQLSPNSERERLNLMRAKIRNGKGGEVYSQMNQFYVDTDSRLSADEITQELERKDLELPSLKMKNLFDVVKSLVA